MKSIPKTNISFNFYHLPPSTRLDRKANTTNSLYSSYFFSNFLSFDARVFIFFMFCISSISSNNRSSHRKCSIKREFLEISQNSQENTCTRVSFLIKLPETLCFLRTPLQNTYGHGRTG